MLRASLPNMSRARLWPRRAERTSPVSTINCSRAKSISSSGRGMRTDWAKFRALILPWPARVAKVTPIRAMRASTARTRIRMMPRRRAGASVGANISSVLANSGYGQAMIKPSDSARRRSPGLRGSTGLAGGASARPKTRRAASSRGWGSAESPASAAARRALRGWWRSWLRKRDMAWAMAARWVSVRSGRARKRRSSSRRTAASVRSPSWRSKAPAARRCRRAAKHAAASRSMIDRALVEPLATVREVLLDLGAEVVDVVEHHLLQLADPRVEVARDGDVDDQESGGCRAPAGCR